MYLQNELENMNEVIWLVDNVIIKLQFNVETQRGFNFLESFLQCAKWVIWFNIPFHYFSIFCFSQKGFPIFLWFLL